MVVGIALGVFQVQDNALLRLEYVLDAGASGGVTFSLSEQVSPSPKVQAIPAKIVAVHLSPSFSRSSPSIEDMYFPLYCPIL